MLQDIPTLFTHPNICVFDKYLRVSHPQIDKLRYLFFCQQVFQPLLQLTHPLLNHHP